MKKPNKTTTDNLRRTLVIHNLSIEEYKAILKFCKKKKINHSTEVYDEEGFCVYLNAVADENITVEAELY